MGQVAVAYIWHVAVTRLPEPARHMVLPVNAAATIKPSA